MPKPTITIDEHDRARSLFRSAVAHWKAYDLATDALSTILGVDPNELSVCDILEAILDAATGGGSTFDGLLADMEITVDRAVTRRNGRPAIYPDEKVLEVVRLSCEGVPRRAIAERLGTSDGFVNSVLEGRARSDITGIRRSRKENR